MGTVRQEEATLRIFKWNLLNDESFVYLVSDTLTASGYVVRHQGDGPDGGVDVFATQSISFAFDTHPFTWAVQCKFSASPSKAVNDSEIRDVEGILRSSRFQSLRPRGYLLVTNRRISQNVVERLRGINDQSEFRTCGIDGNRLMSLLHVNPGIVLKYFTNPGDGRPVGGEVKQLQAAIDAVIGGFRSNQVGMAEIYIARRTIAKADRDLEIAILRYEANHLIGGDDLEPSFIERGRVARERLEQMGVSLSEGKEKKKPNKGIYRDRAKKPPGP